MQKDPQTELDRLIGALSQATAIRGQGPRQEAILAIALLASTKGLRQKDSSLKVNRLLAEAVSWFLTAKNGDREVGRKAVRKLPQLSQFLGREEGRLLIAARDLSSKRSDSQRRVSDTRKRRRTRRTEL